jgi:hypothetical protein
MGRVKDGAVIEIFEWKFNEPIEQVHMNSEVQKMWNECAKTYEDAPASQVKEIFQLFPNFEPLN